MDSIATGLDVDFVQPTVGMIVIAMAARVFLKEFMGAIIFVFVYVSTSYGLKRPQFFQCRKNGLYKSQ